MNTQDQWFEPGTKVVRVADARNLGLPTRGSLHPLTEFGRILCVDMCWFNPHDGRNHVDFVGIDDSGWFACCFRRIEEIQLCVRAAEKFKQNEEVEV